MPITIAKYKCNECDDIFEATSEEWALCKCEKSEVKPSQAIFLPTTNEKKEIALLRWRVRLIILRMIF